jgi:hypothetical protein
MIVFTSPEDALWLAYPKTGNLLLGEKQMKKQANKVEFNEQEQTIIASLQESRGITRKAAVNYFNKHRAELLKGFTPLNAGVQVPASAVDFKAQAANDDTPVATPAPAPEAPKSEPTPATPAGDARKEGIRLFALAGKPKKEDFKHVYGDMGAKWTWVARAKAVGLETAEEAAKEFQRMRAGKPLEFVKAVTEEK